MKFLIFDFDGTIVDSKSVYYHALETRLIKMGFSKNKIEKTIDLGLNISETLRNLGFSWFVRLFERRNIMKEVLSKVNQVKKCKDVDSLKKLNVRKILLSNSFDEFIYPVLKHLNLERVFDEVYGADDFENKEEFIKDYLERNWLKKNEVLYIGDRVTDVKLARKLGIKVVIISGKCSWNSKKDIKRAKPDYIIKDIKEMNKLI